VSSPEHPAKVISATADELQLATTDDDIQEGKADVTLKLTKPLPASQVPQAGTMLTGRWVGKATSYTPLPPAQPAQNAAGGQQQQAGAAAQQQQTGAAGQQAAAGGANPQQPQPAGCLPNTGGGVMLTLTEGSRQDTTPKKTPPRRSTTTRRRSTARH
jgi:hypothetical protein